MTYGRLWSIVAVGLALGTGAAAPRPAGANPRPKLLVLLAVDQMRGDYYAWYGARWKHGLKRLFAHGAWFRSARFPYLSTVTCPGHATLGTGAFPHRHGMVLNGWYDRQERRSVACTSDESMPLVAHQSRRSPDGASPALGRGDSAKNLAVPTLGDELKTQLSPRARVVGVSAKARAAISLTGRSADLALWWQGGSWVTSKAFVAAPVPWVERFIARNPIDETRTWTKLLPPAAYRFEDEGEGEVPPAGWTRTFPHAAQVPLLPGTVGPSARPPPLGGWGDTPFVDETLGRLARAALSELKLGRGPGTDLLAVSFSMTDVIGHRFGPHSHEVQDALARLDVTIGQLLDAFDQQVGRGMYTVALSADHGVAPLPERARTEGHDAGRIAGAALRAKTDAAVTAELGAAPVNGPPHVVAFEGNDLYLGSGVHDRLRAKPGAMARVLAALGTVPGVAQALDSAELANAANAQDAVRRAAALSHFPGRSGDLVIVPKMYWFPAGAGTSHGTTQAYDQHVPVVFYGAGIRRGRYDREVTPADVAPTLGALVGVKMPQAEGAPLKEAIEPAGRPRARAKP